MLPALFHLFASYRREDDVGHVGRAVDHLNRHFRAGAVFQDVALPVGTPLDDLLTWLRTSRTLIAFMGPHWAIGPDGTDRFADENDWIRQEITTALAARLPILPVQLPGARIPRIHSLPAGIRPVLAVKAAKLDSDDWPGSTDRLTVAVERYIAPAKLIAQGTSHLWVGRIHASESQAIDLFQNALAYPLHVVSAQPGVSMTGDHPWYCATIFVMADSRTERIDAGMNPPNVHSLGKSGLLQIRRRAKQGPLRIQIQSSPLAVWEGWEARNRYNVGAIVGTLMQMCAAQGLLLEHLDATPLGQPVFRE